LQVWHVADRDRLRGEQGAGQNGQGRILGAGDPDLTLERGAALNLKFVHV